MLYFLSAILILILFYFWTLRGRVGFADFKAFKNVRFAHRGLYGNGVPENSLWAFRRAIERGFGAELDVHLTSDRELVVIHDSSLKRTTGMNKNVEDLTLKEIENYRLEGTDEKIPTLKEVLELFNGQFPLIIELKTANNNVNMLCLKTAQLLKTYKGKYCIESFDPRCVKWFKNHCPQIIRGQLSENFLKNKTSDLSIFLKVCMTFLLSNFLTKPDFIAYKFKDRNNISFKICTKLYKIQGVSWTIKSEENILLAEEENLIPIFEEKKTV